MENTELLELLEKCKKKNSHSQELLFKYYYNSMLCVCRRYSRDIDEAKDILQEGFIKVFKNLDNFQNYGNVSSWVKKIMLNTAIDLYRKKKKIINFDSDDKVFESNIDDYSNADVDYMFDNISAEDIHKATEKLSPKYRLVFNLYLFENLTHAQIAERLNIAEGTSKSNYSKAKLKMKELLSTKLNLSSQ